MDPRQRLLTALDFKEPDHVPLDLGSTQVTGIHAVAYQRSRQALGLPPVPVKYCDYIQQLALPDPDFLALLGVDVRGLFPLNSHNWKFHEQEAGEYWIYHDEWGITHRRPRPSGLYHSLWRAPLDRPELTIQDLKNYAWPDFSNPQRIAGLRQLAEQYQADGYAVVIKDPFAGIFEMAQRIVGMENLLRWMASEKALAVATFDQMAALKLAFWEMALPQLGQVVDVISQTDDYGSQTSQIISPRMYRELLKPLWKVIIQRQKELAPHTWCFFHSCGNVRPLIPDFIEIGVNILNPIHIRAKGMDPLELKRDFGRELVFWGGGVDTQHTLPHGSPQEVRDEVKRNLEALAPGGGFIFNTIHNIQADIPAENLLAMYETVATYGVY